VDGTWTFLTSGLGLAHPLIEPVEMPAGSKINATKVVNRRPVMVQRVPSLRRSRQARSAGGYAGAFAAEAAAGLGLDHPLIEPVEMPAASTTDAATIISRPPMMVVEHVPRLR